MSSLGSGGRLGRKRNRQSSLLTVGITEDTSSRLSFNTSLLLFSFLAVGKTSLITRFMYDSFDNTYQVGATVCLCLCVSVNGRSSGQRGFFELIPFEVNIRTTSGPPALAPSLSGLSEAAAAHSSSNKHNIAYAAAAVCKHLKTCSGP